MVIRQAHEQDAKGAYHPHLAPLPQLAAAPMEMEVVMEKAVAPLTMEVGTDGAAAPFAMEVETEGMSAPVAMEVAMEMECAVVLPAPVPPRTEAAPHRPRQSRHSPLPPAPSPCPCPHFPQLPNQAA